jgi:uncharacterized Fe-S cluster-containing radical SAM superfamily enzyme
MVNMKRFEEKLREWENSFGIRPLLLSPRDFGMHAAKKIPKVLQKNEKTEVEIILPGRIPSNYENRQEMLGRAKNRIIQIMNSASKIGDRVKVNITSNKDNIYYGREINK